VVPRCLTIAGSDSGGGAGIQADLKTFARLGCHGMSAVTVVTAQCTTGVTAAHEVPAEVVREQLAVLFSDIGVDAAKTGMLVGAPAIEAVAGFLGSHRVPLVVDPVMAAPPWAPVPCEESVGALVDRLLPLATVVTPDVHAACALAGVPFAEDADRGALAEAIHGLGAAAVLVTGAHRSDSLDWLFDGERHLPIPVERYRYAATHGFGCTFSAALCAMLARGVELEEAVRRAGGVATAAVRGGFPDLGAGNGPVDVLGIEALGAR
jgi:hydroxymethylpyrimidine/phosphomethylpyrimidine kinase